MPWAHAFLPQTLPHFITVVFETPLSLPSSPILLLQSRASRKASSPNTHPQLTSGFRTTEGDKRGTEMPARTECGRARTVPPAHGVPGLGIDCEPGST